MTSEVASLMTASTLLSIGYGDRPWEDFLQRLRRHRVEYVIDVRSRPGSRQAEFNRESLIALLDREGIQYVYMGDTLGGQPDDPACYTNGKVDYEKCRGTSLFEHGLDRLIAAKEGGHSAAIMCSELDPERCHRSKLIGEALAVRGHALRHIDRDGTTASQSEVIDRLTGGQSSLFGDHFTSRERHAPKGHNE